MYSSSLPQETIGASLGAGSATNRTPLAKYAAPKPLFSMPSADDFALPEPEGGGVAVATVTPMGGVRWALRQQIASARELLVELRVHASSAAVRSPAGQAHRQQLVDTLFTLLTEKGGDAVNIYIYKRYTYRERYTPPF